MIGDDIHTVYTRTKWALVLRGVLGLLLGAFILARPLASVAALALIIAIWALLDGVTSIVRAFAVRRVAPHWWVMLLTGAVSVAFGIAALYYYPVLSLTFVILWISFWLISAGVMAIVVGVQERRFGVSWGWTIVFGVIAIVGGVLDWSYPGVTLAWLLAFIAAYGIISGIAMLLAAWKLRGLAQAVDQARNPARA